MMCLLYRRGSRASQPRHCAGDRGSAAIRIGCDGGKTGLSGLIPELLSSGFEFFLMSHKGIYDYRIKMRP